MNDDVLYEVDRGVATLTLNRPDKLNALRFETVAALTARLREAEADRSVGVVVITGVGKAFSVGGDLAVLSALEGDDIPR